MVFVLIIPLTIFAQSIEDMDPEPVFLIDENLKNYSKDGWINSNTFIIQSGSMMPTLKVNEKVDVDKNVPFEDLEIGDIIVFNRPSDHNRVIVHRVVSIINDDPITLRTKGDANPASIPGTDFPITEEEYIGKVTKSSEINCGTGTEWVDGICQIIKIEPKPTELQKYIPEGYEFYDRGNIDMGFVKVLAGNLIKDDEYYVIKITQVPYDEQFEGGEYEHQVMLNGMWDQFKQNRFLVKYVEDVTNLPATCYQGWADEHTRVLLCIVDEFTIQIQSNKDSVPLMRQILSKINNDSIIPENLFGGGCLIATAAYGTELAPQVQQLRELRDNKLLQTKAGTSFINTFNDVYYSFSPIIADLEREHPLFKEVVKIVITPMISSLSILNYVDMNSEAEVLGYGISLIVFNVGLYFVAPVIVLVRIRKKF